jgi:hypothetical protein
MASLTGRNAKKTARKSSFAGSGALQGGMI